MRRPWIGLGALLSMAACGDDAQGDDDRTAADLQERTNAFVHEACACEPASKRPPCRSHLQALTFDDCEIDAIMSQLEPAQDSVNCYVDVFERGERCLEAADCDPDQITACGDALFREIDACPMNTKLAQAIAACEK